MLYDKRWEQKIPTPQVDEIGAVLLKAAEVIRKRGHCKHFLSDNDGAVCLMGAINAVVTGCPDDYCGNHQQYADRVADFMGLKRQYFSCYRLCTRTSTMACVDWNNSPDRTKEEVIAALEGAAGL